LQPKRRPRNDRHPTTKTHKPIVTKFNNSINTRFRRGREHVSLFVYSKQIVWECLMSFREMLVALVSILDNLAVGLIIIPAVYLIIRIVYLVTGICRGIETLAFALFRVRIQKPEQGKLNI
jgi:hypothetical protein